MSAVEDLLHTGKSYQNDDKLSQCNAISPYRQLQTHLYYPSNEIKAAIREDFSDESLSVNNLQFSNYLNTRVLNSDNICDVFKTLVEIEDVTSLLLYPPLTQKYVTLKFLGDKHYSMEKPKIFNIEEILTPYAVEVVVIPITSSIIVNKRYEDAIDLLVPHLYEYTTELEYRRYIGTIVQVTTKHIIFELAEMHLTLPNNRNVQYHVLFRPLRMHIRAQYEALDMLRGNKNLRNYLFPKFNPFKNHKNFDLQLFYTEIADNPEQLEAVCNITAGSNIYAPFIIFGPPGTGKTTIIIESILQLRLRNPKNRILVTAGSNTACDTIALHLYEYYQKNQPFEQVNGKEVIRVFSQSDLPKVLHNINDELLVKSNFKNESFKKMLLKDILKYGVIIATLCTVAKKLNGEYFSHIFVDEAAASTEPEALLGIVGAKSEQCYVILSGDPKQLGPKIQSPRAANLGLGQSLLERLINSACYALDDNGVYDRALQIRLQRNYRSHPKIVHLYNQLYYDNSLLADVKKDAIQYFANWEVLPNPEFPIIFQAIDGASESVESLQSSYNTYEIDVIIWYLHRLLNDRIDGVNVTKSDIGIIATNKMQCKIIQQHLMNEKLGKIEVGPVEQYQGREKSIILVSLVCADTTIGFLNDSRRLNVLLSRAKSLLILFGNPLILGQQPDFQFIIKECVNNGALLLKNDQDEYKWNGKGPAQKIKKSNKPILNRSGINSILFHLGKANRCMKEKCETDTDSYDTEMCKSDIPEVSTVLYNEKDMMNMNATTENEHENRIIGDYNNNHDCSPCWYKDNIEYNNKCNVRNNAHKNFHEIKLIDLKKNCVKSEIDLWEDTAVNTSNKILNSDTVIEKQSIFDNVMDEENRACDYNSVKSATERYENINWKIDDTLLNGARMNEDYEKCDDAGEIEVPYNDDDSDVSYDKCVPDNLKVPYSVDSNDEACNEFNSDESIVPYYDDDNENIWNKYHRHETYEKVQFCSPTQNPFDLSSEIVAIVKTESAMECAMLMEKNENFYEENFETMGRITITATECEILKNFVDTFSVFILENKCDALHLFDKSTISTKAIDNLNITAKIKKDNHIDMDELMKKSPEIIKNKNNSDFFECRDFDIDNDELTFENDLLLDISTESKLLDTLEMSSSRNNNENDVSMYSLSNENENNEDFDLWQQIKLQLEVDNFELTKNPNNFKANIQMNPFLNNDLDDTTNMSIIYDFSTEKIFDEDFVIAEPIERVISANNLNKSTIIENLDEILLEFDEISNRPATLNSDENVNYIKDLELAFGYQIDEIDEIDKQSKIKDVMPNFDITEFLNADIKFLDFENDNWIQIPEFMNSNKFSLNSLPSAIIRFNFSEYKQMLQTVTKNKRYTKIELLDIQDRYHSIFYNDELQNTMLSNFFEDKYVISWYEYELEYNAVCNPLPQYMSSDRLRILYNIVRKCSRCPNNYLPALFNKSKSILRYKKNELLRLRMLSK